MKNIAQTKISSTDLFFFSQQVFESDLNNSQQSFEENTAYIKLIPSSAVTLFSKHKFVSIHNPRKLPYMGDTEVNTFTEEMLNNAKVDKIVWENLHYRKLQATFTRRFAGKKNWNAHYCPPKNMAAAPSVFYDALVITKPEIDLKRFINLHVSALKRIYGEGKGSIIKRLFAFSNSGNNLRFKTLFPSMPNTIYRLGHDSDIRKAINVAFCEDQIKSLN